LGLVRGHSSLSFFFNLDSAQSDTQFEGDLLHFFLSFLPPPRFTHSFAAPNVCAHLLPFLTLLIQPKAPHILSPNTCGWGGSSQPHQEESKGARVRFSPVRFRQGQAPSLSLPGKGFPLGFFSRGFKQFQTPRSLPFLACLPYKCRKTKGPTPSAQRLFSY